MRAYRIAALLTLVLTMRAAAQSASASAAATITTQDVKTRIDFLASDQLKGRDTPSPGLEMAADYIAKQFAAFGLKPGGDNGTYLQRWPYRAVKVDVASLVAELRGAKARKLVYGQEFFVVPSATTDTISGELVFGGVAGANSAAKQQFAKNVVAFYIPGGNMDQPWMQALQTGFIAAMSGGARGVVFILDPLFKAEAMGNVVNQLQGASTPLPILAIRYDVARDWLKQYSVELENARLSNDPAALGKASFALSTGKTEQSNPPNVVGILEGSDSVLKNTYVVYSAHMDHVGVGQPNEKGDSIYNGADDDASGTTAVIEIAQAFTSMKERPKRSLIFLLVSGEEKGLFGSAYFVASPPVPAKQMIANINIDMIGRNSPDTTVAIGQDYSSLGATMQTIVKAHPELKLTVAPDLWPEENLFVRSDHFNFARVEIPAIFFTSGLHADYHKPSDEAATIDTDKLARTARLLFYLGYDLANTANAPTWTEAGLKVIKGQ